MNSAVAGDVGWGISALGLFRALETVGSGFRVQALGFRIEDR